MRVLQSRVDAPCAGVSTPRVSNRAALCRAAQTDLPVPVIEEASGCPVSAVKNLFKNSKSKPLSKERQEEHDRAPLAPGPPALSLESALDVSQILRFGIHEAMLRFNNKYGDVCRFANPASLNDKSGWIFVNDPDVVQYCSALNVGNYQLRFLPDIYTWVTHGQGILGSQGDYNAKHRRLCSPMFRTTKLLRQFSHIITDRAVEMTDSLAAAAKSRGSLDCDVSLHTQRLTLDIVGLTAFSYNFQQIEQTQRELNDPSAQPKEDKILWAVNTFGETLASVFITPLPVLKFLDKLGFKELKQLSKSVDIMRESMLEMIHARRNSIQKGEKTPDDLLGTLLSSVDPEDGSSLTDEELWEDVHDVMGAGHETTGTTTAAVLYCVSTNPEVEEKLIAELRDVCGDKPPSFEDLENLVYLNQVVKEVLRLYPAIPMFPREASTDDILPTGHRVDAGDVVFMSTYTLGRSDRIWDEPLKFDPERFSPENVKKHHKFQFLPFGAGARMCVGATWAEMSVSMMAATLLQKLKFTAISPNVQPIPVEYDITMNFNPTNGLHMNCAARED